MSEALAAWWGNPVTGVLSALVCLALLGWAVSGFIAIVRLGSIQLGGLLAHRSNLLPGFPRRGEAYVSLVVVLLFRVGLFWALFSLAVFHVVGLIVGGGVAALLLLVSGWSLAVAFGLAAVRGSRVEPYAGFTLGWLRWWTPVLVRLAHLEGVADNGADEDEEEESLDEHEVQAFIGAGEKAGILEREDAEMVASVVELSDTVAREIMTPRTDVVALPVEAPFETVRRRFAESMFTRLPAYRETLDRIDGMVHVKDVLKAVDTGATPSAGALLRPVLVVPETKTLRDLLREFQTAHQQLAVVVDEYGGTSGIVTLEDVLEEIVGEIQDEHQRETPDVQEESPDTYLVRGSAHVEVLEELFGVDVGEVPFDSVAGLVLDRLGRLPRVGDKAVWHGLELEAVDADRRRLRRVRVRRAEPAP